MRRINKRVVSILGGGIAGLFNVLPMVFQRIKWDTIISTFLTWVVVGLLISISSLKIKAFLKGIIITLLVNVPLLIYVAESSLIGLFWSLLMAIVFGGLLGYALDKFGTAESH